MMHDREGARAISSQPTQSSPSVSDKPAPERVIARIELPWRTVVRVILILAIIWLIIRLWSILLLLLISLLLTAALNPAVVWLQRRGLKRSGAVSVVLLGVLAVFVIFLLLLIPPIVDETSKFIDDLPAYVERTRGLLQDRYPTLYARLEEYAQQQASGQGLAFDIPVPRILSAGAGIFQGISNTIVVLVITAYLLLDGGRIYRWSVRYLPDSQEVKVRRAMPEISSVVSGYVVGQIFTSLIFGIFAFIVLSIADVPQPLFLALLAAILDAVPIIGVFVATIPAFLLALTVSVPTAIAVLIAYVVYQQVENYVIVPRVYRGTLQISSFAVLVAVIVGGELLGIIGVLMALPIAAAIPVVERIWIDTAPKPSSVAEPAPAETDSEPA
jgi:predicted PurR-regulated permease PerM